MLHPPCERFDLREIAPQPWKNGAGLTRAIAVSPIGSDASTFDWRISVAEVERDGPFSAFPGIDRCIVLLRGAGMLLHGADGGLVHRLDRRHEPFHFSGDLPLDATLLGGPQKGCQSLRAAARVSGYPAGLGRRAMLG